MKVINKVLQLIITMITIRNNNSIGIKLGEIGNRGMSFSWKWKRETVRERRRALCSKNVPRPSLFKYEVMHNFHYCAMYTAILLLLFSIQTMDASAKKTWFWQLKVSFSFPFFFWLLLFPFLQFLLFYVLFSKQNILILFNDFA